MQDGTIINGRFYPLNAKPRPTFDSPLESYPVAELIAVECAAIDPNVIDALPKRLYRIDRSLPSDAAIGHVTACEATPSTLESDASGPLCG